MTGKDYVCVCLLLERLATGIGELHLVIVGGSSDRTKCPISDLLAFRAVDGYLVFYPLPNRSLVPQCMSSHNPRNLVREYGK